VAPSLELGASPRGATALLAVAKARAWLSGRDYVTPDDVKAFGQKMIDDHTQLNNQMAPITESKGVALPRKMGKADQAEYDKLAALSGEAFDKEYIAYMVKDHHTDLREFRMAAMNTNDPDLKVALDHAAKVIREHMVMADKLAHEKGLTTPGRGVRPQA